MTTLPKDILSCLFAAANSYAKCSMGNPDQRACVIYSTKRKTIVSMGFQVDMISPEYNAHAKLRWLDRGDLYAICSHVPTASGAEYLIEMKVKEVYYMEYVGGEVGLMKLKLKNIPATRLIYG
jgi:hypothetical protein